MSVNLKVVASFAANAVHAGLRKLSDGVTAVGAKMGKMKAVFAGFGGLGSLLGAGGIGKMWQDAAKMAEDAFARMDFSKISRSTASSILAMKNDFENLFTSITSKAATAFAAIGNGFRKTGAFFGAWSVKGVGFREALKTSREIAEQDNKAAADEAIREAEMQRMLKHTASGLEIMAKRRKEAAEAAKKEADEQAKIADELSKSAAEHAKMTKGQGATLAALAVGPMSNLRAIDKQKRQEARDARELDRLQRNADRKKKWNELGIKTRTLTRREELALAARDAVGKGDPLHKIEQYTKKTADTIKAALSLK